MCASSHVSAEERNAAAVLREQRPNSSNHNELMELMSQTRMSRREWIGRESPSITEILRHYPRIQDMPDAVLTISLMPDTMHSTAFDIAVFSFHLSADNFNALKHRVATNLEKLGKIEKLTLKLRP